MLILFIFVCIKGDYLFVLVLGLFVNRWNFFFDIVLFFSYEILRVVEFCLMFLNVKNYINEIEK